MDGQNKSNIKIGALVDIVLKQDQRNNQLTRGHVKRCVIIYRPSEFYSYL